MATQLHDAEKRLYPRIDVDIKCMIVFNNETYNGCIKNISRHGLYIRITSELTDQLIQLSTNDNIKVSYSIPSGEKLVHECTVRWLFTLKQQLNLGVEVSEPPSAFMNFVMQKESSIV